MSVDHNAALVRRVIEEIWNGGNLGTADVLFAPCGGAKFDRPVGAAAWHDRWAMLEFLALLLGLLGAALRDRSDLVAENLLLRQQLAVLARPTRKRPRLRARDKLFWVLVRWLWRDWRRHLILVRPETVVGWRRQGWRMVWRRRSRGRPGRPRLSAEVQALIARMARENPGWGSERIRGELLKLGIVVSKRSIQGYRGRGPARPPSQTWRTFLANHLGQRRAAAASAAADADVSAFLGAAVRHPPAACPPASARDGEPDRSALAPAARSDGLGTAAAFPDRRQPHASARDPVVTARASTGRRRPAAATPRARVVHRVLRSRAPPIARRGSGSLAPVGPTTGSIRVRRRLDGLPHRHERAA